MIDWFGKRSTKALLMQVLAHQYEMEQRIMGALEDALAAEDAVLQQVVALIQGLPDTAALQAQVDAANAALAALQADHDFDATTLQAALDEIASATSVVTSHTSQLQALVPPAPEPTPEPLPGNDQPA